MLQRSRLTPTAAHLVCRLWSCTLQWSWNSSIKTEKQKEESSPPNLSPKFWDFTALERGEGEAQNVTNEFPANDDRRELSQISLIC